MLAVDFQYSRTPDFLQSDAGTQEAWFRDDVQALADFLAGQNTNRLTEQPHVTTLVVPDGDHALETGDAATQLAQ